MFLLLDAAPAPKDKPSEPSKEELLSKHLKLLEGKWKIVSITNDKVLGKEKKQDQIWEFRQTRLLKYSVNQKKATPRKTSITLDPSKSPPFIDMFVEVSESTLLGIYDFDKDKLIICYGANEAERPTKFVSDKQQRSILVVLEPVKDGKK
jgi:uncharacterized protein (TIGR03067 family)